MHAINKGKYTQCDWCHCDWNWFNKANRSKIFLILLYWKLLPVSSYAIQWTAYDIKYECSGIRVGNLKKCPGIHWKKKILSISWISLSATSAVGMEIGSTFFLFTTRQLLLFLLSLSLERYFYFKHVYVLMKGKKRRKYEISRLKRGCFWETSFT